MVQEKASHTGATAARRKAAGLAPAIDYILNPEKRLVSIKCSKKVNTGNIVKCAAELRANPLFSPDFSAVVDLSGVEEVDLHGDEFIRVADEIDPFSARSKRAFVARNAVQAHAARLYKILRAREDFEIFDSVAEAEEWIKS